MRGAEDGLKAKTGCFHTAPPPFLTSPLPHKSQRDENNEVFEKVFYAREAALDGENMALIASKASKQVRENTNFRDCCFSFSVN